jgi:hypothetical protein
MSREISPAVEWKCRRSLLPPAPPLFPDGAAPEAEDDDDDDAAAAAEEDVGTDRGGGRDSAMERNSDVRSMVFVRLFQELR